MFFLFSKLFTFILMPYTQMVVWLLLGIFLRNKTWKNRFLLAGLIYIVFFSNRFILNEFLILWEVPPTAIKSLQPGYETGIILGGATNNEMEPRDRIYIFKSAERMTHTVQLYKMGIIKKILVSGGSSNIIDTTYKEADNMRVFLLWCGVPDQDIILENKARNTFENAKFCSEIIKKNYPGSRSLVITSAFHLRRSMGCFRHTGINADGFSTDFYGKKRKFTPDVLFLPDPSAFSEWQMIIREWLGILFYKLAGYI
jgi:uncharacterized SAM-binding protein YcdF (DUF218 family)